MVEIKAQIWPLTKPKIVAWGTSHQECMYVMIAWIKYHFMRLQFSITLQQNQMQDGGVWKLRVFISNAIAGYPEIFLWYRMKLNMSLCRRCITLCAWVRSSLADACGSIELVRQLAANRKILLHLVKQS